jgi:hypothetical protein
MSRMFNCIAKGKEHKKYEFGTKASLAMTKTHEVGAHPCLKSTHRRGIHAPEAHGGR